MKKILLILLIMATSALATDWGYLDDTILIGGESFQVDAYIIDLECEGDSIATVSGTFVYRLLDSISYSYLDTCKRRNWRGFLYSSSFPTGSLAYFNPAVKVVDYVVIGSPSAANTCRLYGYAYRYGSAVEGAILTATLKGRSVMDTCNNTHYVGYTKNSKPSDSTGFYYLDVPWSACLSSSNTYNLSLEYNEQVDWQEKNYTVPSQDSVLLEN